MKTVAIILAGCGVYDGAEIHEAVLTMLSVAKTGATYCLFAPDKEQLHVVNHLNGEIMQEHRNVLIEAARIARGNIKPLSEYEHAGFDALILPGGFGVAKNLCTYAVDGADFKVDKEVENAILQTHQAGKPIGAMCIAPVILARMFAGADLTIGNDKNTANDIEKNGASHIETTHGEIIIDEKLKIVTTPCYMLDSTIYQISQGTDNLVEALFKLC